MKLHQRRNELLAQLQQQHANTSQNNRKAAPMTPPIFQDGKPSQNVKLAKSVTDLIVASRTMSSLIDTMEKEEGELDNLTFVFDMISIYDKNLFGCLNAAFMCYGNCHVFIFRQVE